MMSMAGGFSTRPGGDGFPLTICLDRVTVEKENNFFVESAEFKY